MKYLFFLKIVSLLVIVSSCTKIDVVGHNKDKKIRTVSYFYKDTKIKLLN